MATRAPSVADVRRVLATHLPGRRAGSATPLGAGLDNVTFDVHGELVVRFAREPDPVTWRVTGRDAYVGKSLAALARIFPPAVTR